MSDFRLTPELIAPDAAEAVRAVLRIAEWVRDEAMADPREAEEITRGIGIVETWLRKLEKGAEG